MPQSQRGDNSTVEGTRTYNLVGNCQSKIAVTYVVTVSTRATITRLMIAALPSEISIRTASQLNSSSPAGNVLHNKWMSEMCQTIPERLFKAAQWPDRVLGELATRAVLNDIQQLFKFRHKASKDNRFPSWRPELEQSLLQLQNFMNLQSKLSVGDRPNGKPLGYVPLGNLS